MSGTYVALLRGVNVGGKNKLRMKELVDLFVEAGCMCVRSYIQSGNVLFEVSPSTAAKLSDEIAAQILKRFGFRTAVLLRSSEQLSEIISNNPFVKAGKAPETLHVMFLAGLPKASELKNLDPDRSPPDEFIVQGQEIYLILPNGAAKTRLTNAYFDSKLSTTSTSRNWRTVQKLFEETRR
jgi:uncharacterized protein (DUF1697 family)